MYIEIGHEVILHHSTTQKQLINLFQPVCHSYSKAKFADVLQTKNVFLKTAQNSQENICAGVSF